MEQSFSRLDKQVAIWATSHSGNELACRCEQEMSSCCNHIRSTAIVSIVSPTHIIVGNAGDSRAVISRGGSAVPLSVYHKVDLFAAVVSQPTSTCCLAYS
jgi:protein phosphatase 2C